MDGNKMLTGCSSATETDLILNKDKIKEPTVAKKKRENVKNLKPPVQLKIKVAKH
jgi:hypothetical protein